MNKINKELVLAIVVMLSVLIGCCIQQSLDANKPPSVPPWEDPEMYQDIWFEPYDGR